MLVVKEFFKHLLCDRSDIKHLCLFTFNLYKNL